MKTIKVTGAKVHNLKNISVEIPRDKLVVITWVSWSGKSSLAFDTIYAEGQRRYVESLSAYARQFLDLSDKPEVESIEWLSPAIAINQKTISNNPRSTVWTITEIYDYLRLLYAKAWRPHCPICWNKIVKHTVSKIVDYIANLPEMTKIMILAPIVRNAKWSHAKVMDRIEKKWFVRFRVDWKVVTIAEDIKLDEDKLHNIEIVIDRIVVKDLKEAITETKWETFKAINSSRTRLADSVELALSHWEWYCYILDAWQDTVEQFCERFHCPIHEDITFQEFEPRTFSFNSPHWACETCHWLWKIMTIDEETLIPNRSLTIAEWALHPWSSYDIEKNLNYKILKEVGLKYDFDFKTPVSKFSEKAIDLIMHGTWNEKYVIEMDTEGFSWKMSLTYAWLCSYLLKKYSEWVSDNYKSNVSRYMKASECTSCHWKRLKSSILSVTIMHKNIIDVTYLNIQEIKHFLEEAQKTLTQSEKIIVERIIKEILNRLEFLIKVGLSYLNLDRWANTLSWGEGQRIRLATQIWSALQWVLYVLDEPSIWLHQKDNARLIETMQFLRNLWNTVLVVEHDEDTIRTADYIVEIGPHAGKHWWEVVAIWTYDQIISNSNSITWKYLSWEKQIEVPKRRRRGNWTFLEIIGAKAHNLKDVSVKIPLWCFVWISGVSWSWKSTLINQTLVPELWRVLNWSHKHWLEHDAIKWIENLDKLISIDQSAIWRTPKSNPATYCGVFNLIRELFSTQPESKVRAYKPWRFSFNIKWWRCEECSWDWVKKIEMHFLPDVYIPCEVCWGKRYNRETLEISYRWKNIFDVLEMTASEALEFFGNIPKIKYYLQTLEDVWLGYIHLWQASTQLSGWEAQRIKLATELAKIETWRTIYILDEPTTWLHFDDINKLLKVLQSLIEKGNSVIVIEHNLDVIKTCDYVIDLWPEWGTSWGEIVAKWTPEEICKSSNSHTAKYLAKLLK